MISRRLQIVIAVLIVAALAMGFYFVHLKRKAETAGAGPATPALTAPINGPPGQLTLYVANDADSSIRPSQVASAVPDDPAERARVALHMLLQRYQVPDASHRVPDGADVEQIFLLDPNSAVVNLTPELANSHPSGIGVEQLTVFSLVMTLQAQIPSLGRVHFLVDGHPRDTLAGHFSLADWIDVNQVTQTMAPGGDVSH